MSSPRTALVIIQDDTDLRLVVMSLRLSPLQGVPHLREKPSPWNCSRIEATPSSVSEHIDLLVCRCATKGGVEEAVRTYLAWKDILDDQDRLDLQQSQIRQVESQIRECESNMVSAFPAVTSVCSSRQ